MRLTNYLLAGKSFVFVALATIGTVAQVQAQTAPSIRFVGTVAATVNENAGTLSIPVSITNPNATASTVQVSLVPGVATATAGPDFTFAATQTITFPAGATGNQTLTIQLSDDAVAEGAEYFVLRLQDPTNATLVAAGTVLPVYIKDNDTPVPTQSRDLTLTRLGSYQNFAAFSSDNKQINSAEIVAHDPTTQRLYVVNSVGRKLDILSLATPAALTAVASIDISMYGNLNSVAVRNGVVACAIENIAPQQNGSVVFFDQNGIFQKQVTAGALPDLITFSPDGQLVITANEGEPTYNYSADPEGSVTVIDLAGGVAALTQANVTTVSFASYNGQAAQLRADGIRIYGGLTGALSTVAQDLEPEYVAVSADSRTAYITLQENNALATLDLTTKQFTSLRSLGFQDHRQGGFTLDASDQTPDVLMANWPIRGLRQPDALATFEVGGQRYLITANEGDARDYDTPAGGTGPYSEVNRLGAASYVLDPTAFPDAALLKNAQLLGRLNVTNKLGDTDGDGDFDQIYAFGGRSFSIFNATTGALVHDSGDLLERVISTDPTYGAIFNASNGTGNPVRKNRSDDKGPEPEGVTTGVIDNVPYAFVSLERIGGVAVFNLSDPTQPKLVQYINNRSTAVGTGDQGPEGILFISAANSPTGQPLLLLANEISSTVSVYGIQPRGTGTATASAKAAAPLQLFPNPTQGDAVRLSRPVSGTLTDLLGRPVRQLQAASRLETAGLAPGIYVLKAQDGATAKLLVR